MACLATHFSMRGLERELGFLVIVKGLAPSCFHVAILATMSQVLVMTIVILVATVTTWRNFSVFDRRVVTLVATHIGVGTAQGKVGARVIEGVSVKGHDVGVSPSMFGVARAARALRQIRNSTVQALVLFNVLVNILVTGETEIVLRTLLEGLMAVIAVGLVFKMRLAQFSGHN